MKRIFRFCWIESTDGYVVIEVDTDKLTTELAHEINNFRSNAKYRLTETKGDVHLVVARMFAAKFMQFALSDGGVSFHQDPHEGLSYVKKTLQFAIEGWPDAEALGILIRSANVDVPDFYSLACEVLTDEEGGAA